MALDLRGLPPTVQRALDALTGEVRTAGKREIGQGVLVSGVELATGSANSVAHNLGRKPKGWLVVSPQADARIWQSATPDATYLYLNASAAVTTALWVF